MADDSLEVTDKLEFHPCDTPRGSQYYDLKALTVEQQEQLNELKLKMIREDEIYLSNHPEIRAIIVLILRQVFKYQPRKNLDCFIGGLFLANKVSIENEINYYLTGRKTHIYRGDSAVLSERETSGESLLEFAKLQAELEQQKRKEEAETITAEVLGEVVENIFDKIEAQHLEDTNYIKQIVTDELIGKTGDRFKADFKNFLIDELVKRISSERYNFYYDEDITLEENNSDELSEGFNTSAIMSHDDQETLHNTTD